jgi:hypothetical protein
MANLQEIWMQIEGYEGRYEISNLGRAKSKQKILKPQTDAYGYYFIRIAKKGEKQKTKRIGRLVGLHFIPNPENKEQINHINGIKKDNRATNLEWVTRSENVLHAYNTGLNPIGENHIRSKLKEHQVKSILELRKSGITQCELSEKFRISRSAVRSILDGTNWKRLTEVHST